MRIQTHQVVSLIFAGLFAGCNIPTDYTLTIDNAQSSGSQQPCGQGMGQGMGSGASQGQGGFPGGPCIAHGNSGNPLNQPYDLQDDDSTNDVIFDFHGFEKSPTQSLMQPGDHLGRAFGAITDLQRADVQVFEILAPISDALIFYPQRIGEEAWESLTEPLSDLGLLQKTEIFGNLRVPTLSTWAVLQCAQQGCSPQTIRQFLTDAELALKCVYYSQTGDAFTLYGPDGRNFCRDVLDMDDCD